MRFSVLPALAAAVALSGCVVAVPATQPGPVVAPPAPVVVTPRPSQPVVVTPAPTTRTVDAGSARQVVSAELARRYPGRNVGPMADCIIANATMAEQAELLAAGGTGRAADAMAAIVRKPATGTCIARAAA